MQREGRAQQRVAGLSLERTLGQQPVDGLNRLSMASRTLQEQTQAPHGLQGHLDTTQKENRCIVAKDLLYGAILGKERS